MTAIRKFFRKGADRVGTLDRHCACNVDLAHRGWYRSLDSLFSDRTLGTCVGKFEYQLEGLFAAVGPVVLSNDQRRTVADQEMAVWNGVTGAGRDRTRADEGPT